MQNNIVYQQCENCGDSKIMCRKYKVTPTDVFYTSMKGMTPEQKKIYCRPPVTPCSSKLECDKALWHFLLFSERPLGCFH